MATFSCKRQHRALQNVFEDVFEPYSYHCEQHRHPRFLRSEWPTPTNAFMTLTSIAIDPAIFNECKETIDKKT